MLPFSITSKLAQESASLASLGSRSQGQSVKQTMHLLVLSSRVGRPVSPVPHLLWWALN